jgi:hypothetical protein
MQTSNCTWYLDIDLWSQNNIPRVVAPCPHLAHLPLIRTLKTCSAMQHSPCLAREVSHRRSQRKCGTVPSSARSCGSSQTVVQRTSCKTEVSSRLSQPEKEGKAQIVLADQIFNSGLVSPRANAVRAVVRALADPAPRSWQNWLNSIV